MPEFWRKWIVIWCWAVIAFGAVLLIGGFEATKAPIEAIFLLYNPDATVPFDDTVRFGVGLMGALTLGWGLTLLASVRAALSLGRDGRALWGGITMSVFIWYLTDSLVSVMTGFVVNAGSNTLLLIGYLLPIWRSGLLGSGGRVATA